MITRTRYQWIRTTLLAVGSLAIIFPLYMTISIALKTPAEMGTLQEVLGWPTNPRWQNFAEATRVAGLLSAFQNSFAITFSTILLTVTTNSMVGYAIGRNMKRRLYRFLFYYFVSAMFIPFAVIMLPVARHMSNLNLHSIPGLIILYVVYGLPLNVFFYAGYMKTIPADFEEAAWMDGASTFYTFWKLIFPLMKPMHATVIIFASVWSWNDFLLPLIILNVRNINTLALAQFAFQAQFSTNYNLGFASYLLALIPMVVMFLAAQKWIIAGLTGGGIAK